MNLIAIDIGNSSIDIGFFIEEELFVQKIDTKPLLPSSEYSVLFAEFIREKNIDKMPDGIIISSVVPGHTDAVKKACSALSKKEPVVLTHKMKTGIDFQIEEPEKLGTDRIAAAAGACDLFGAPVAVIDFGTATTLNFIGSGNKYKGGAIMPGLELMRKLLFSDTAQLPDVTVSKPMSPLGKDTVECIRSGIVYGTAGAVERIISETEKLEAESFKIVVTGGNADLIVPFLRKVDYIEQALVLKGLRSIYERNQQ
ncbi:MAG: type III pantothenate kinase [Nitrospirae bacterium]|nr:type III pantothenate kinase [Nitrospirota bacterium]MBI3378506.1 type III pantothenate kinase [Nitrospirota bacterium]